MKGNILVYAGGQPVSLRRRCRGNPSALGRSRDPLARGRPTATGCVPGVAVPPEIPLPWDAGSVRCPGHPTATDFRICPPALLIKKRKKNWRAACVPAVAVPRESQCPGTQRVSPCQGTPHCHRLRSWGGGAPGNPSALGCRGCPLPRTPHCHRFSNLSSSPSKGT